MAQVHKMLVEIDPRMPVQEICAIISGVSTYHPGKEAEILKHVQEAIDKRLQELEKLKQDKPE